MLSRDYDYATGLLEGTDVSFKGTLRIFERRAGRPSLGLAEFNSRGRARARLSCRDGRLNIVDVFAIVETPT